jgi:hypothetical protein
MRSADAEPGIDDDLRVQRAAFDPHVMAQRKA